MYWASADALSTAYKSNTLSQSSWGKVQTRTSLHSIGLSATLHSMPTCSQLSLIFLALNQSLQFNLEHHLFIHSISNGAMEARNYHKFYPEAH